jgi:hypothetical protein
MLKSTRTFQVINLKKKMEEWSDHELFRFKTCEAGNRFHAELMKN